MAKKPIMEFFHLDPRKPENALCAALADTHRGAGAWLFEACCGYKAYEAGSGKSVTDGLTWENAIKKADAICAVGREPYKLSLRERDYREAYLQRGQADTLIWRLLHGAEIVLVEAKETATLGAIGQLKGYGHLLEVDFGCKVRHSILLAAKDDYATSFAAREEGIRVIIARDITTRGSSVYRFEIDPLDF